MTDCFQLPIKKHAKTPFTTEDDIRLARIITENPHMKWEDVAAMMGDRNVRQCKERWENYLCPDINKTPFTHSEDILLLTKLNEWGKKWRIIAKSFDNRTDISLKSRFKVLQRKGITLENVHNFREPYQFDEVSNNIIYDNGDCYCIGKQNRKKKLTSKEKKQTFQFPPGAHGKEKEEITFVCQMIKEESAFLMHFHLIQQMFCLIADVVSKQLIILMKWTQLHL